MSMTIRTEIYDGAKMFDLSGVVNGKYPKHEVKRLSLYISRTKFRPLVWRNTHPYVMCDRVEDVTSQQGLMQQQDEGGGQVADRDVMLYGYVRGTHLRQQQRVHLIGVGDFDIAAVTSLEDPCHQPGGAATPAPTTSGSSKASSKNVLTSLKKKDNLLYAPMANVGRVKIDSDGVYIELKQVHYTKTEHLLLGSQDNTHHQSAINDNAMGTTIGNTPADLLRQMQDTGDQHHHPHRHGQGGGHGGMHDAEMSLFAGSTAVKSSSHQQQQQQQLVKDAYDDDDDEEEDNENDDDDDDEEEDEEEEEEEEDENDDDDGDGEEDDAGHASSGRTKQHIAANTDDTRWKEGMLEKAAAAYVDRSSNRSSVGRHGSAGGSSSVDVMRHVYGNAWSLPESSSSDGQGKGEDESDEDDDDDDLFVAVKASVLNNYRNNNCPDCNRHIFTTLASSSSSSLRSDVSSSSSSGIIAKAAAPTGGDYFSVLRIRFVTGGAKAWGNNSKKGRGTSPGDDESDDGDVNGDNDDDDDDEVYDDFEDLTETNNSGTQGQQQRSRSGHDDDEEEDDEEGEEEEDDDDDSASEDSEAANEKLDEQLRQAYAKKKGQAKASFDADYDQRRDKRLGKVSEGVREKNRAITCRCLVYYYMSCID